MCELHVAHFGVGSTSGGADRDRTREKKELEIPSSRVSDEIEGTSERVAVLVAGRNTGEVKEPLNEGKNEEDRDSALEDALFRTIVLVVEGGAETTAVTGPKRVLDGVLGCAAGCID